MSHHFEWRPFELSRACRFSRSSSVFLARLLSLSSFDSDASLSRSSSVFLARFLSLSSCRADSVVFASNLGYHSTLNIGHHSTTVPFYHSTVHLPSVCFIITIIITPSQIPLCTSRELQGKISLKSAMLRTAVKPQYST